MAFLSGIPVYVIISELEIALVLIWLEVIFPPFLASIAVC